MRRSACAAALLIGAASAGAQDRGGYVMQTGTDTVAVESYTRTAGNLDGRLVVRGPPATITYYQLTLRADSSAFRLQSVTRWLADSSAHPLRTDMIIALDSALVTRVLGDSSATRRMPVRNAIPWIESSIAILEPFMREFKRGDRDTVSIRLLSRDGTVLPLTVRRMGEKEFELRYANAVDRIHTDEIGRITRWVGGRSRVSAVRQAEVDIEAIARDFTSAAGNARPARAP